MAAAEVEGELAEELAGKESFWIVPTKIDDSDGRFLSAWSNQRRAFRGILTVAALPPSAGKDFDQCGQFYGQNRNLQCRAKTVGNCFHVREALLTSR